MGSSISEKDHYFPILIALKAAGGKEELDHLRESVATLIRVDFEYRNTVSGPKTSESRFEKDFNWAGKRLSDAGLLTKARTHWILTETANRMNVAELLSLSHDILKT
jgi:hypothetical protein